MALADRSATWVTIIALRRKGRHMTKHTPELQAILRRVETLEIENKRLRRAGVAVLLVVIVAVATEQTTPNRTLQAQESAFQKNNQSKSVPALQAEEIANKFEWVDKDCRTWGADGKIDVDQTCLIVTTVPGHLDVMPNEHNDAWAKEMSDPKTSQDRWVQQFFSLKRTVF
jgi:hypothetical protein